MINQRLFISLTICLGLTGAIACSTTHHGNLATEEDSTRTVAASATGDTKRERGAASTLFKEGDFVTVPKSTFLMGSPPTEPGRSNEEILHAVSLTSPIEVQTTTVTQLQWYLVTGTNPSFFKSKRYCEKEYLEAGRVALCPNNPVEQVSWEDTQNFIQKLNNRSDGYTYRLPTEAEWEYAARAGSQAAYHFGNDSNQLTSHAWFNQNSGNQTHPVATKAPNAYGLYDMHGNVSQWVQDSYGPYLGGGPGRQPGSGNQSRVYRGGNCNNDASYLRSASRNFWEPDSSSSDIGFRLVRSK